MSGLDCALLMLICRSRKHTGEVSVRRPYCYITWGDALTAGYMSGLPKDPIRELEADMVRLPVRRKGNGRIV